MRVDRDVRATRPGIARYPLALIGVFVAGSCVPAVRAQSGTDPASAPAAVFAASEEVVPESGSGPAQPDAPVGGLEGAQATCREVRVRIDAPVPRRVDGWVPPLARRPGTPVDVGRAQVVLVRDGVEVARGQTDDGGSWCADEITAGDDLLVVARSPSQSLRVGTCAYRRCKRPYATWAAVGPVANDHGPIDVMLPRESPAAAGLHIFAVLARALTAVEAAGLVVDPLRAEFYPGESTRCATTCMGERDGYVIDVLGEVGDSDPWDTQILLHELGHFVDRYTVRTGSPGGYHDGTPTDPLLAFSEGFATFFALLVDGDPVYADSHDAGAAYTDYATNGARASAAGPLDQPLSEDLVVRVLRDAFSQTTAEGLEQLAAVGRARAEPSTSPADLGARGFDLADAIALIEGQSGTSALARIDAAGAAAVYGFPEVPSAEPARSPITPAGGELRCDADGTVTLDVRARAALDHARVRIEVRAADDVTVVADEEPGSMGAGTVRRLTANGLGRDATVVAHFEWELPGGADGVWVASAVCGDPAPGPIAWLPTEDYTLPDGTRLLVTRTATP